MFCFTDGGMDERDAEAARHHLLWACAETPLTQFGRRGDHLMRTPMHDGWGFPRHSPTFMRAV